MLSQRFLDNLSPSTIRGYQSTCRTYLEVVRVMESLGTKEGIEKASDIYLGSKPDFQAAVEKFFSVIKAEKEMRKSGSNAKDVRRQFYTKISGGTYQSNWRVPKEDRQKVSEIRRLRNRFNRILVRPRNLNAGRNGSTSAFDLRFPFKVQSQSISN